MKTVSCSATRRPYVRAGIPASKPGICSFIELIKPATNEMTSHLTAPAASHRTGPRVDASIKAVGGRTAQLLFSGLAPGIVGLYQVNVVVPSDAATGNDVELTIRQSGVLSRSSRIAVQ